MPKGEYTENCPYCDAVCDADWCDVDVGMIQCGPFHCMQCQASQIGPYDKTFNPFKRNYDWDSLVPLVREPKPGHRVLTKQESDTGWYEPATPPGSSANVIGGHVVSHRVMRDTYKQEFSNNQLYEDKAYVDNWWEGVRK